MSCPGAVLLCGEPSSPPALLGGCSFLLSKLLKPSSVLTHQVLQPPDHHDGPFWCHPSAAAASLGSPELEVVFQVLF